MPTSVATRRANQANADLLALSVPPPCTMSEKNVSFTIKVTSDLFDVEHDQIWRLFEENMHELYRSSSFGWDPKKKRKEMFNRLSRFVIAREISGSDTTNNLPGSEPDIIAYSIFRFERENRQNVVYCYELQVSKDARRLGLGRLLIRILSDIGAQWGMTKVMLTAFKTNHAAVEFYKSTGFTMDEMSPDFSDDPTEEECDYIILSRCIS